MTLTSRVLPGGNYTVQPGDSLWSIAVQAYQDGTAWPKIYEANKQVIGREANIIHPGEVLHIPPLAAPTPTPNNLPLKVSTNIQGDILAGFNKDFRTYLFLQFHDQPTGRAFLKDFIPLISKTKEVAAFDDLFSLGRHIGGSDPTNLKATWVNISLTIDGLKLLLNSDPSTELSNLPQKFTSF